MMVGRPGRPLFFTIFWLQHLWNTARERAGENLTQIYAFLQDIPNLEIFCMSLFASEYFALNSF